MKFFGVEPIIDRRKALLGACGLACLAVVFNAEGASAEVFKHCVCEGGMTILAAMGMNFGLPTAEQVEEVCENTCVTMGFPGGQPA